MSNTALLRKVASIQMTSGADLGANLDQAELLIQSAVSRGAELLVLPENFAYLGCKEIQNIAEIEKSIGPARKFLAEQASKYKVWIVGGTIPVKEPSLSDLNDSSLTSASCFVVDSKGVEVSCYRKMHLFDAQIDDAKGSYCESSEYSPGSSPVVVDTPIGRVGIAVCYDLRFPELFRYIVGQGAEIIVIPSAFTTKTGKAHWSLLLRARAVENLAYVVGANMGDRDHPKQPTWGGSAIIDPWGTIVGQLEGGSGVVVADIDLSYLSDLRNKMPVHKHRQFSVAKPLSSAE